MRVRVVSAAWKHRDKSGRIRTHLRGEVVDVDKSRGERLIALGIAVDDAAVPAPDPVSDPEPAPVSERTPELAPPMAKPKKVDRLELWQDYARSVGVDPSKLSKAELIAKIG